MNKRNWFVVYGLRLWVEMIIVLNVLGILIYLQVNTSDEYIARAQMAEPVGLARDMQMQMVVFAAMKGEWPTESAIQGYDYTNYLEDFKISEKGNLLLNLKSKKPEINNKILALNLYELDAGQGYSMYVWTCGESGAPAPYKNHQRVESTIASKYINIVCRN